MSHSVQTFILLILCSLPQIMGKVFATCDLLILLQLQGFPQNQLKDWLCLIEAESTRQTDAIGGPDADGSFDYGLFQINDRYWCSNNTTPGKGCNVTCQDLLSDDITKASECAMTIYRQQGFEAWVGWVDECKGKLLPAVTC